MAQSSERIDYEKRRPRITSATMMAASSRITRKYVRFTGQQYIEELLMNS
jgi:hypothetical protein